MANDDPKRLAVALLKTLNRDRQAKLLKIERYVRGEQDLPYIPPNSMYEYKKLAENAVTNVCAFVSQVPVQGMYVDSFRRGTASGDSAAKRVDSGKTAAVQPEWDHWQQSRFDDRQHAIYRGALDYGHSFVLTYKRKKDGMVLSRGLSPLMTTAVYEDPASDEDPVGALHVLDLPGKMQDDGLPLAGTAEMWDDTRKYEVTFRTWDDPKSVTVKVVGAHGLNVCPVTRFTCAVDLEGRTTGVVEPMIRLQDRLNQGVFDLLVTSTYSSFKVRTVTGMAPPVQMEAIRDPATGKVTGHQPKLDDEGNPIAKPINISQSRLMFAEDHETRFGSLEETPLDGFIESIKMTFQHIAALSETPPHHLLGQIANLSAEALQAAESALMRKIQQFQASFGESWERVFRLAAAFSDDPIGEHDYSGEVIWRDLNNTSLAQAGDALGKLAEQLDIPKRGLWARVPHVTATEMAEWDNLREQENFDQRMADAMDRQANSSRPAYRRPAPTPEVTDGASVA